MIYAKTPETKGITINNDLGNGVKKKSTKKEKTELIAAKAKLP